jgi:predicted PurR-regulated permease PerM
VLVKPLCVWGTVAFILNYVPILGPAAAFFISCSPARSRSPRLGSTWQALLPAALYIAIHVIGGETATPMLLARRFTLNPVLVIFSFVFWFWLWGVPGAILSAPILATTKIVPD